MSRLEIRDYYIFDELNRFEEPLRDFHGAKSIGMVVNRRMKGGEHRSLDTTFREDDGRFCAALIPENMALIRKIALNLVRRDTVSKKSLRQRQEIAGWNNDNLVRLLVDPDEAFPPPTQPSFVCASPGRGSNPPISRMKAVAPRLGKQAPRAGRVGADKVVVRVGNSVSYHQKKAL